MKKSKIKQETKLWNFNSSDGQYDENGKIVITNIHKGHKHDIIWHDAKTTTVEDAGRGDPGLNWDCAELMLLIKKTYEDGTECTIFSMGYYDEKRDKKIWEFRQPDDARHAYFQYTDIEGELIAFSFVEELSLLKLLNNE
jgi:hypothetical protein